jgi:hypothetical protein
MLLLSVNAKSSIECRCTECRGAFNRWDIELTRCDKSSSFELRLIERLAKPFFYSSITKKHLMKLQVVDKMTLHYSIFLKNTYKSTGAPFYLIYPGSSTWVIKIRLRMLEF